MTRRLNVVLLILLIGVFGPFFWLVLDTGGTGRAVKPVDIAQLRLLAEAIPGPLPREVRYERIGRQPRTADLVAAGSGLRQVDLTTYAFQIVREDGTDITIDRGMSRRSAQRRELADFDPEAQASVERVVRGAALALRLTRSTVRPPAVPYPVAPGVVVIPTPGVGPGTRMIFVRLAEGRELLFAGEIAPLNVSWRQDRPPPRAVTLFHRRPRVEIAQWLRTIRRLKWSAPLLVIVPGRDPALPPPLKRGFAKTSAPFAIGR